MRKKVVETKKVEVEKEVVISDTLHCNVCDKEIKNGFWMVYVSNDVEPWIAKDICSTKCLTHMLNEYVKHETAGVSFEASYVAGEANPEKPTPEEGGPKPK